MGLEYMPYIYIYTLTPLALAVKLGSPSWQSHLIPYQFTPHSMTSEEIHVPTPPGQVYGPARVLNDGAGQAGPAR